jgi:hypothetical protein
MPVGCESDRAEVVSPLFERGMIGHLGPQKLAKY